MSRVTRSFFDRLRRWGLPSARLPYDSGEWWDKSYTKNEGHPIEWGGMGFAELSTHEWVERGANWSDTSARRVSSIADDDLAGRARQPGGDLLVLGGGTSRLSQDFFDAGWPSVLDVEISPEAVKQSRSRVVGEPSRTDSTVREAEALHQASESHSGSAGGPGLEFIVADARSMRPRDDLQGRLFDACIDKGLVDALWCAGAIAAPTQVPQVSVSVAAALKPGVGTFMTLSYSGPEDILPLLLGDNTNHGTGEPRSRLWASAESRQLRSIWLYVLRRSALPFHEASCTPAASTLSARAVATEDTAEEDHEGIVEATRQRQRRARTKRKKGSRRN